VRDGVPHAGYRYCANWGSEKKHGRFSVTSNIDGHWGRVMGADELWECHGAVTHMQSSKCSDGPIWTTDPHAMARAAPPPWDLRPGELVEVQVERHRFPHLLESSAA
jgi:NAD-dependent SIR2 family protein deacetylase